MRARDLLWKSAQLLLALVFVLMGVYGGDMPLGLLCASLLSAAVFGPSARATGCATATALSPVRARAALRSFSAGPRPRALMRLALRAYGWLGWAVAAASVALIAIGRPIGATLTTLISVYVGLWLFATAASRTARLLRPAAAPR